MRRYFLLVVWTSLAYNGIISTKNIFFIHVSFKLEKKVIWYMDGYFVTSQDAERVTMRDGLHRRTMATTDEAMLCEFIFAEGTIIHEHSHMNDQVGYIVSGKLELTIGSETRICHQGDSYAIPGGIVHFGRAIQETVTIEVFSPPRNDYRLEAH